LKTLLTIVLVLVAVAAGAVLFAYSGVADVSAVRSSPAIVDWLLETTSDHSIDARGAKIIVPDLSNPQRVPRGAEHYQHMCATCHGAPGVDASEIGRGLNPTPPQLVRHDFSGEEAAVAFWVIQNGIRMTGMPAFGPSHTDEQIWDIVAFLQKMHGMSPEDYARLQFAGGFATGPGEAAEHGEGAGEVGTQGMPEGDVQHHDDHLH
jgi:mono/diheme cytochrome c family protein